MRHGISNFGGDWGRYWLLLALVFLAHDLNAFTLAIVQEDQANSIYGSITVNGSGCSGVNYSAYTPYYGPSSSYSSGFASDCTYGGGKVLGYQIVTSCQAVLCGGGTQNFYPGNSSGTGNWSTNRPTTNIMASPSITNNSASPIVAFLVGNAGNGGLLGGPYIIPPGGDLSDPNTNGAVFQWAGPDPGNTALSYPTNAGGVDWGVDGVGGNELLGTDPFDGVYLGSGLTTNVSYGGSGGTIGGSGPIGGSSGVTQGNTTNSPVGSTPVVSTNGLPIPSGTLGGAVAGGGSGSTSITGGQTGTGTNDGSGTNNFLTSDQFIADSQFLHTNLMMQGTNAGYAFNAGSVAAVAGAEGVAFNSGFGGVTNAIANMDPYENGDMITNFNDSGTNFGDPFTLTIPSWTGGVINWASTITLDMNIRHNSWYQDGAFLCRVIFVLLASWKFLGMVYEETEKAFKDWMTIPQAQGNTEVAMTLFGTGISSRAPSAILNAGLTVAACLAIPLLVSAFISLEGGTGFLGTVAHTPQGAIASAIQAHTEVSHRPYFMWGLLAMSDFIPLAFSTTLVFEYCIWRFAKTFTLGLIAVTIKAIGF